MEVCMQPRWLYCRHFLSNIQFPCQKRRSSSDRPSRSRQQPEKIAVIGGGITGLTAAYYASRRYPLASITLFESSMRLGGLIESEYVSLDEGPVVVCEKGPRTLRANAPRAPVTYDLIHSLGLRETLVTVPKQCPTSSTRYILYPDHLVAIPAFNPTLLRHHIAAVPAPSTLQARQLLRLLYVLLTEPLFTGLLGGLLRGVYFPSPRSPDIHDESIGSFLSRHFGYRLVDNLASAIMNGLCAGNIYRLSTKALLPGLWDLETRAEKDRKGQNDILWPKRRGRRCQTDSQRLINASLTGQSQRREDDLIARLRNGPAGELETKFRDTSVFSFRRGLQELPSALEAALIKADNVQLHTETSVENIKHCNGGLEISISGRTGTTTQPFSHVIVTTPYNHVLSAANLDNPPITTVTVMVVTLCFKNPLLNRPYRGFGYLIPNSVPAHQNPEHALGVIFDSDAMPDQDQQASCTKITVVLGGHWWAERTSTSLPTESEGLRMARRLLQRHLGITEDPVASVVTLQRDAIPQYEVGHCDKMARLHGLLLERLAGRLRVAGGSYRGIGVHDCVFSARSVVEGLEIEGLTGLECFVDGERTQTP
ncbi:Protoporphyrinogen oxidase [Hypoxylon sp. EC38]|nr:Protoporphyrinogen oxidase [Hypoxylon sp. EC38]